MLFQTVWLDYSNRVTEIREKAFQAGKQSMQRSRKGACLACGWCYDPGGNGEGEAREVACGSHCCLVGHGSLDYILNDKEDHWTAVNRGVTI